MPSFADPGFVSKLRELRQTDNTRNWIYLFRTYAVLAAAVGGACWFYQYRAATGLSFWWNVPVTLMAIAIVGAVQHQLGTLAHEAVHRTLFKNRYLNDLVSEWLCSFPIFSSTYHYGLHHLAHHQFVNDPDRDPDISQMEQSGHRLIFPILRREFIHVLLSQLWLPNLVRYSLARAEYDSLGTDKSPYLRADWKFTALPAKIVAGYMAALAGALVWLSQLDDPLWLGVIPAAGWLAIIATLAVLPERFYYQSKVRSLIPVRVLAMMRATFFTLLFCGLAWGSRATGWPWGWLFLLLWIVPLLTSFPLYMVLRQIVQHGNADRGALTNTRVFRCNPLVNYAVFPLGQDYHLPHHLFANVPHYRLRELHEAIMSFPEYREHAQLVEGYVLPMREPAENPTVIEVLGPDYASGGNAGVYIDDSVLEEQQVSARDKAAIRREGAAAQAR